MSGNNDTEQLYKMVEKLEIQQADTNHEMRSLTRQISELVAILARREGHDEHVNRRLDDCENRITNHSSRLIELEKSQVGTAAEKKIWDLALKAAVTVVVGVVLYGAFKSYGG